MALLYLSLCANLLQAVRRAYYLSPDGDALFAELDMPKARGCHLLGHWWMAGHLQG